MPTATAFRLPSMLRRLIGVLSLMVGGLAIIVSFSLPAPVSADPIPLWSLLLPAVWLFISGANKVLMVMNVHRTWEIGLIALLMFGCTACIAVIVGSQAGIVAPLDRSWINELLSFSFVIGWPLVDFIDLLATNFHVWQNPART